MGYNDKIIKTANVVIVSSQLEIILNKMTDSIDNLNYSIEKIDKAWEVSCSWLFKCKFLATNNKFKFNNISNFNSYIEHLKRTASSNVETEIKNTDSSNLFK